jgi:hypothetical protein
VKFWGQRAASRPVLGPVEPKCLNNKVHVSLALDRGGFSIGWGKQLRLMFGVSKLASGAKMTELRDRNFSSKVIALIITIL